MASQRLQHSTITAYHRDNGSLRNLEVQTSPTFDLPIAKALNGDRLYLSLQQEADGNRLIVSSNHETDYPCQRQPALPAAVPAEPY